MNKKGQLNFWVDVLLAAVMVGLTWTGALLYMVLPPGTGHSRALLGMGRHDFGQWHFYLSLAAVVLVILHVVLHWDWVACMASRTCGKDSPEPQSRRLMGVALSVLLVLGFLGSLWLASVQVKVLPSGSGHGQGQGHGQGHGHDHGSELHDPHDHH